MNRLSKVRNSLLGELEERERERKLRERLARLEGKIRQINALESGWLKR